MYRTFLLLLLIEAGSLALCSAALASPTEHVLYAFKGGNDGALPNGGLVADAQGDLFGTTSRGGLTSGLCQADDGCGTAFELQPRQRGGWTENVIHRFGPFDHPTAGLVIDAGGDLFGTTSFGGSGQLGTVFELRPPNSPGGDWTYSTLHDFAGGSDGATPVAPLALDPEGDLFGTTELGGGGPCSIAHQGHGCGTVFELRHPLRGGGWKESILSTFAPFDDFPMAGVAMDRGGHLFGTTAGDQTVGFGSVFELSPPLMRGGSWTLSTLYLFGSIAEDGLTPFAGVTIGADGNLYGSTAQGGSDVPLCKRTLGCGTVYALNHLGIFGRSQVESQLYAFKDGPDGGSPYGGVIADKSGDLYGTTLYGGAQYQPFASTCGCGTVFEMLRPAKGHPWRESVLYAFSGGSDGQGPSGDLLLVNGALFGTTGNGGGTCAFPFTCGTVFEIVP